LFAQQTGGGGAAAPPAPPGTPMTWFGSTTRHIYLIKNFTVLFNYSKVLCISDNFWCIGASSFFKSSLSCSKSNFGANSCWLIADCFSAAPGCRLRSVCYRRLLLSCQVMFQSFTLSISKHGLVNSIKLQIHTQVSITFNFSRVLKFTSLVRVATLTW
jgi:hypothetical protein